MRINFIRSHRFLLLLALGLLCVRGTLQGAVDMETEITTKILQSIREDIASLHKRFDSVDSELEAFRADVERRLSNVENDLGLVARAVLRLMDPAKRSV